MLEKNIWKTSNFWIETIIFLISVLGSIFISYGIIQGFLLLFVSNIICFLYFFKQKQYPLALQSVVFLIITILGIVKYKKQIFYLK